MGLLPPTGVLAQSITIRNVPDETSDELAARAALTGRSLQEYLRARLVELAQPPDAELLMARDPSPQGWHPSTAD